MYKKIDNNRVENILNKHYNEAAKWKFTIIVKRKARKLKGRKQNEI